MICDSERLDLPHATSSSTWMSQIDFYTAVAAGANIALAFLGAIVSVYEKWTKKHRRSILVSSVAPGCIGFVAVIVDASKSARHLQDANARVKAAVDEAGREEVAATTGADSFCYAKIDATRPTKPGTLDLMVISSREICPSRCSPVLLRFAKGYEHWHAGHEERVNRHPQETLKHGPVLCMIKDAIGN